MCVANMTKPYKIKGVYLFCEACNNLFFKDRYTFLKRVQNGSRCFYSNSCKHDFKKVKFDPFLKCHYYNNDFIQDSKKYLRNIKKNWNNFCSDECRVANIVSTKVKEADGRFLKRFWEKINVIKDKVSCWEWTSTLKPVGYGSICIHGKTTFSHRKVQELMHGKIPNNLHVLHKCDNRKCCRPSHLFLGNHQDNMDDMIRKGRNHKGENHFFAKLTEQDVRDIRILYGTYSVKDIAKMYNVDRKTISSIGLYKSWRSVI